MDSGDEQITDEAERAALRAQARKVQIQALAATAAATAALLLA